MHPWNEPVLGSLRERLSAMPHALLIHGPRGTGKLALAERIAQLLLCEAPDTARRPCGACEGCRWFAGGNHPDYRRIEPEALAPASESADAEDAPAPARKGKPSNEIKVDQVRELADFLNVGSHRGGRRIALVHPAEEMNANAANALLKGLEEPPPGAMFLLVTHRPARLLPTILSRCVRVPVSLPERQASLDWLGGQGLRDAARWLAYAGGAPLMALRYGEQAEAIDKLLNALRTGSQVLPDTREDLEALAEALQKLGLDQALAAHGLPPKYGVGSGAVAGSAKAWLSFTRQLGSKRALTRHPVNSRLFAAEMQAGLPKYKD